MSAPAGFIHAQDQHSSAVKELEKQWGPSGDVLLNDPRLDEAYRSCLGLRVYRDRDGAERPVRPGERHIYWRCTGKITFLDRDWTIGHMAEVSCPWDQAMKCDRCELTDPIVGCTFIRFGAELIGFVLCDTCARHVEQGFAPVTVLRKGNW
jgi:hypothetical protein